MCTSKFVALPIAKLLKWHTDKKLTDHTANTYNNCWQIHRNIFRNNLRDYSTDSLQKDKIANSYADRQLIHSTISFTKFTFCHQADYQIVETRLQTQSVAYWELFLWGVVG